MDEETEEVKPNPRGKVIDLIVPIVLLIICCVVGMIYTGGFFSGTDFVTAFSQSEASLALSIGSFFVFVFTVIFYAARRVLSFRDCMDCIPEGFKAMVPAILILTFAWTLKAMTDSLGADVFVAEAMESVAGGLLNFLPAIIFLVGCALAFATGTSWGTFGILIPIVAVSYTHLDVYKRQVVALANLSNNLNQTLASGERVLSILEETPQVEEVKGKETVEFQNAGCEHVTFRCV